MDADAGELAADAEYTAEVLGSERIGFGLVVSREFIHVFERKMNEI